MEIIEDLVKETGYDPKVERKRRNKQRNVTADRVVTNVDVVAQNSARVISNPNAGPVKIKEESTDIDTNEIKVSEVGEPSGSKEGKKQKGKVVKKPKVGTDITVDSSTGAQKFFWNTHVTNAKSTQQNVMVRRYLYMSSMLLKM